MVPLAQGFELLPDLAGSPPAWFDTKISPLNKTDIGLSNFGYDVYSKARILRIRAILVLMLPVSLDAQSAAILVQSLVIQINTLLGPTSGAFTSLIMGMVPGGGRRRGLQDTLYTLIVRLIAALRLVQAKVVQLAVLQVQLQKVAFGGLWYIDGCSIGCCY